MADQLHATLFCTQNLVINWWSHPEIILGNSGNNLSSDHKRCWPNWPKTQLRISWNWSELDWIILNGKIVHPNSKCAPGYRTQVPHLESKGWQQIVNFVFRFITHRLELLTFTLCPKLRPKSNAKKNAETKLTFFCFVFKCDWVSGRPKTVFSAEYLVADIRAVQMLKKSNK